MSADSMIPAIFLWIVAILAGWFVFVEVVIRIMRRFFPFPIPAFIARLIDNPIRRRIQRPAKVVDWMGVREGMSVLEIGPGPGTFTIEAAKRVGEGGKVFAIDIEPKEILRLESRLHREKITNVTTKVASAYELPFPEKAFHIVFRCSRAVLVLVPNSLVNCFGVVLDLLLSMNGLDVNNSIFLRF